MVLPWDPVVSTGSGNTPCKIGTDRSYYEERTVEREHFLRNSSHSHEVVNGRAEGRERIQTSPVEEKGNENGKVAIAHGSVEFCEATPIGLADES